MRVLTAAVSFVRSPPTMQTFLSKVITNESWICGYDPETKQQTNLPIENEEQSEEKAHHFQRICPVRPNSQFLTLL
jgi:hypothetical protein